MLLHVEVPEPRLRRWTPESLAALPKLVLIADGFSDRGVAYAAVQAVQAGVQWVHLRDHSLSERRFWEVGRILVGRLRRVNEEVLISVNGHVDFAEEWHTGAHVGAQGPPVQTAKQRAINGPVGYSAHNLDVADAAFDAGADYVFYSPVFATASKPGHPGVGVESLRQVCEILGPKKVFALGGVRPERVARCMEAGAAGVAVVSSILGADDPKAATQAFLSQLARWTS